MERVGRAFAVTVVLGLLVAGLSVVPPIGGSLAASDGDVAPGRQSSAPATEASNHTLQRLPAGDGAVVHSSLRPRPNLGSAVDIGDRELAGQIQIYESVRRLQAARNLTANRTVVRNAIDRTQGQIEMLRDAEREAVRAYYEGRIDDRTLLQRLARIDAAAGSIAGGFDHFMTLARSVGPPGEQTVEGTPLGTRAGWIQRDLAAFESPIRERLNLTFRGVRAGPRVSVTVSASGAVFETIADGTYVRDAVRFDNYDPTQPPELGLAEAVRQVEERYPALTGPEHSTGIASDPIGGRLWRILLEHDYGRSEVYVDRSTRKLYREVHRFRLEQIPTRQVEQTSGGEFILYVNASFGGDPYLVRVRDPGTGRPVDATVTVDGRRIGTTGSDGNLWILGGTGEFSIAARTDQQRLSVNVSATG